MRNFFIKYQDRLLYGTDLTLNPGDGSRRNSSVKRTMCGRGIGATWPPTRAQRVEIIKADVPGLALPREVIDKVYYRNAARAFALNGAR